MQTFLFHISSYGSHYNKKDCPSVNSSSSQAAQLKATRWKWKPLRFFACWDTHCWSNLQSEATSGIKCQRNQDFSKFGMVMNTTSDGADTLWKSMWIKVSLFLLIANWPGCKTMLPISRHEMAVARNRISNFLKGNYILCFNAVILYTCKTASLKCFFKTLPPPTPSSSYVPYSLQKEALAPYRCRYSIFQPDSCQIPPTSLL